MEVMIEYTTISSILLAITFAVKMISAQCTTNGCFVCSDTELVCEGLNIAPPLEDLLEGWRSIDRISLTNGAIKELPEGYFRHLHLRIIDLSNNQLTTFNISSFEYTTGPRTLDLTGNKVVCDSNIVWLRKWQSLHPSNTVIGNCTGSGKKIGTYLSDKPRSLINIWLADSFRAFDRKCTQLSIPVILDGEYSSPLDYRAYIDGTVRRAVINVAEEHIQVQPGDRSFQIHITIENRGESRDDVAIPLKITPKYPISHARNIEIRLENGAHGCTADVPVLMTQKPSSLPDVSELVTQSSTDDNPFLFAHTTKSSRNTEKSPTLGLFSTLKLKEFADPTSNAQTSMTALPSQTAEFTSFAEYTVSSDLISTEQSTSFPLSQQPRSTHTDSTSYQETTGISQSENLVRKSCTESDGCTVDVSTLIAQKTSSLPDVSELVTQSSTDDDPFLFAHTTKPSRNSEKLPTLGLFSTLKPIVFADPTSNAQTSMTALPSQTAEFTSFAEYTASSDLISTEQSTSFPLSQQPRSTFTDSTPYQETTGISQSETLVRKSCIESDGCTVDVSTLIAQKTSSLPDVSELVTQSSTDDDPFLFAHTTKSSRTTEKSPTLGLFSTLKPKVFADPTSNAQTLMVCIALGVISFCFVVILAFYTFLHLRRRGTYNVSIPVATVAISETSV